MAPRYPAILDRLGKGAPARLAPIGGGCIADARVATFADGSSVFVKQAAGQAGMFEREAEGLSALAAANAIRVPRVLAVDAGALVLEHIREAPRAANFFEDFGRRFARLHRWRGPACGFGHDNFIGATPQHNEPVEGTWDASAPAGDGADWPAFFLERRLRFQARLASERGHGEDLLRQLGRSEQRLADLLFAAVEPPSILHGDLWSGNFITDECGLPCLVDPAAYFGHREADLAMTRLFGGFDAAFYRAYEEELPLAAGHEERLPMYQLYHLMNHLNLFGSGYYGRCEQIFRHYAR
jgi:fructosamine-3-kinase